MEKINELIQKELNQRIESVVSVGGGCIGSSYKITTKKEKYFLKRYYQKGVSICEARGLEEIRNANKISTPEVVWFDDNYLLLKYIEQGSFKKSFWELFGNQLAQLHKVTNENFGFSQNNFIGSTPQNNLPPNNNWKTFYWQNRILYQIKLAERNNLSTAELINLINRVEKNLDKIIPDKCKPSLIHGDLWSGNFLCDNSGNPVLIDPAVSYSHREAELGMTMLFGGFDDYFYSAYNETFPLEKSWRERNDFYKLYHILNHLNLFGLGYYSHAVEILKKYA